MAPVIPPSAAKTHQVVLMEKARAAASFNTSELSCLIYGSAEAVKQRRGAYDRVETQLGTKDTSVLPRIYGNMDRERAYQESLEMGTIAFQDGIKHGHNFFSEVTPRGIFANASPIGLNILLFIPAIELCGSAEQRAQWLPLAKEGKIIGTYAQTELGHGTFVRGIETTAALDTTTDEFVIHSPTKSSTKFWPGGLGFSSTHAILMARLLVGADDHGPHLFMVQLRSLEDGKPLPGIKLGDIGPKLAYNGVDNSFAVFTNVRISRLNMLMKHTTIAADGTYTAVPNHAVLNYATMLRARAIMTRIAAFQLAQATTIATRYSTVREQGAGSNGTEKSVLQYKHQHFRILTLIAKSYGTFFASKYCTTEYEKVMHQQEQGSLSGLPYMHSLSAGLKAWATGEAADGAEDARKYCGGHGFLMISGLPDLVASSTGMVTFEGENYVLWLQVGRYLIKCVDTLVQGKKLHPEMAYLSDGSTYNAGPGAVNGVCEAQGSAFLDQHVQLDIYRHRATRLVHAIHKRFRGSSKTPEEAWNQHMLSIITAARAHIEYIVLRAFAAHIHHLEGTISVSLMNILATLCSLFALSHIINPRTVDALVNGLLEGLLPEAIALTDAWDFTDASLCSALGMKDGDVYGTMMRWVEQLPINQRAWEHNEGVYRPGWEKWIDPILKAKL
ncbi:acyl-CoA oxidase [Karstenula rhodostoma CBS 690.94]|uniref:Acyl-coenzyme A oxidase n=1 Tax=Karstenula rhodostoma CBS 690.94 TaxID=1392251 RepID=A0A9P4PGU6_9PLEO|nr:acyl-CoA oxidase [Karstenula rhodostoma CBS 690.94]